MHLKPSTFCLLTLLICSHTLAAVEVFFSPSPKLREVITDTLHDAKTIDLALYGFSDRRLQNELKDAAQSGARVRLMLHDARDHEKTATTLEEAGIDVRYVTPIMHHKFAIVNGGDAAKATVLTGSTNWSQMAFTRYDEDLLKFTNEPAIAASFQTEFNHLWSNSREYGKTIHKKWTYCLH